MMRQKQQQQKRQFVDKNEQTDARAKRVYLFAAAAAIVVDCNLFQHA